MATPEFIVRLREKVGHDLLWLVGVTAYVEDARGSGWSASGRSGRATGTRCFAAAPPSAVRGTVARACGCRDTVGGLRAAARRRCGIVGARWAAAGARGRWGAPPPGGRPAATPPAQPRPCQTRGTPKKVLG